jgi:hypothetical protein
MTYLPNRWLRDRGIPTRLLAVTFRDTGMYLVVTGRKFGTETALKPLREDEHALSVKSQMGMGDVEFVTVANPYGY